MPRPMSRFTLGDLLLRHHDDSYGLARRHVLFGVRVKDKDGRDPEGRTHYEDGTMGDIQGALLWKEDSRDFPSWWFTAPPALVVKVPEDELGGGTQIRGAEPKPVEWQPIRDDDWEEDDRYELWSEPEMPDWAGLLPKTWGASIHSGSEEYEQHPLVVPGFYGLMAVNRVHSGLGTRVFELTDDKEPDGERWASLQSAWRVVRAREGLLSFSSTDKLDQLAWQLGQSGAKDKLAG